MSGSQAPRTRVVLPRATMNPVSAVRAAHLAPRTCDLSPGEPDRYVPCFFSRSGLSTFLLGLECLVIDKAVLKAQWR